MKGEKSSDSCGCALGAKFLVAAFILSSSYYLWQWHKDLILISTLLLRVFVITFLTAGAGKIIGISLFHFKRKYRTR